MTVAPDPIRPDGRVAWANPVVKAYETAVDRADFRGADCFALAYLIGAIGAAGLDLTDVCALADEVKAARAEASERIRP